MQHLIQLTVNTTIQNRSLSTHTHGCFPVELEIYMTWNEERYPLKNGDNIYYDILMVDFLMTAYLAYVCTIQSSDTRIIERAIFFFNSDRFIRKNPPTVQELKQQLRNKDTKYISMLRHFSRNIKGGDNFWRSKTEDLKHWITHHIARGHGPPTFFVTLSCAENW